MRSKCARIVSGGALGAEIVQYKCEKCAGPKPPHFFVTFCLRDLGPQTPSGHHRCAIHVRFCSMHLLAYLGEWTTARLACTGDHVPVVLKLLLVFWSWSRSPRVTRRRVRAAISLREFGVWSWFRPGFRGACVYLLGRTCGKILDCSCCGRTKNRYEVEL